MTYTFSKASPTIGDIAYVVPTPGRRIVDPADGAVLPAKGRRRRILQHWLRCEARGEVSLAWAPAELAEESFEHSDLTDEE